jgi:HTH-type transcriptional regulator/antitoxin HigA
MSNRNAQANLLTSESDYRAALSAVRHFFDREPEDGTAEALEFDRLVTLIEDYEARHFPVTENAA